MFQKIFCNNKSKEDRQKDIIGFLHSLNYSIKIVQDLQVILV